ncbi:N-6 DNA methylase [Pantoea dispersa]|uniref:N-6 DNA methylase n=1 Tax=Pantoea dispersa TaxID=59814 RepID=UPI003988F300
MQTINLSKTDILGRYFTNEKIGKILVDSMCHASPSLVVDLGAGDGALTEIAASTWSNAHFLTVDIDQNAPVRSLFLNKSERVTHITVDVLCHDLHEKLNIKLESADAAVCNPPYIKPKWRNDFKIILKEAGLDGVIYTQKDISAELLFIAQNLRILKRGGILGLILPDGIVSGERYYQLRHSLLKNHAVTSVIELPRRIFDRTDAKTHIIVLEKNGDSRDRLTLQCIDDELNFLPPVDITISEGIERLDYSYHKFKEIKSGRSKLGDIATFIARGKTSSSKINDRPYPVFHTTDMINGKTRIEKKFKLQKGHLPSNEIIAEKGDILISRVGRNLSEKVCLLTSGRVVISDCIILIRVPNEYQSSLLNYLTSSTGKENLEALSKGVGAKFLSQKSIMELLF